MNNRIEKIHEFGFENMDYLKEKRCVCYYCGARFSYKEITDIVEDINGDTAICPKCGVDTVVPEIIDDKYVTDEEIKMIYHKYFE